MKTIKVVGAALISPPYVLVFRRGPKTSMSGKWEFPGGKVEPGESDQDALARELREELKLETTPGPRLGQGSAEVKPGLTVVLEVYEVRVVKDKVTYTLSDHDAASWVHADEIHSLDWAAADIPVLEALKIRLLA